MKTNVAATSIDCYHNTVRGEYQSRYYRMIVGYMREQLTPKTRREIGKALGLETNQYSGRCNELIAAGVLVVIGERKCSLSGKNVEALLHAAHVNPQGQLFGGIEQ